MRLGGARRRAAASARALILLLLVGCDAGGLEWGRPPALASSSPADGATEVDRVLTLRVRYDEHLAARTVSRGTVTLRSGPRTYLLSVRYDPILRAIVAREWGNAPLEPNVEHELSVSGVRGLDGTPAEPVVIRFRTGAALGVPEVEGTTTWSQVQPILASRCGPCHDDTQREHGLVLTSPNGIASTAVGVEARQTARVGTAERGLGGMSRIHVVAGIGDPARSYLVYKLLGDAPIHGMPMPPDEALTPSEVATVVDWILSGAPTE